MCDRTRTSSPRSWAAQCVALFFPVTAILHHAVFFPRTCMLNPTGALEYAPTVVGRMLTHDASWALGMVAAVGVWLLGRRVPTIQRLVPPFLIGFIPLTLWIWDIPFADRPICTGGHDGRLVVPVIGHVGTRHVYALCIFIFALLMLPRVARLRVRQDVAT